jgi:hypothetical protein
MQNSDDVKDVGTIRTYELRSFSVPSGTSPSGQRPVCPVGKSKYARLECSLFTSILGTSMSVLICRHRASPSWNVLHETKAYKFRQDVIMRHGSGHEDYLPLFLPSALPPGSSLHR